MFFIICPWPLRRAYPAWAAVIFMLAMLSPAPFFHISSGKVRLIWTEALAETRQTTPPESILTLDLAIEHALAGNPGLGEIKARAEAMATIPEQEGALPDPTVNLGLLNVPTSSFNLHQEDMTMLEVGVS